MKICNTKSTSFLKVPPGKLILSNLVINIYNKSFVNLAQALMRYYSRLRSKDMSIKSDSASGELELHEHATRNGSGYSGSSH